MVDGQSPSEMTMLTRLASPTLRHCYLSLKYQEPPKSFASPVSLSAQVKVPYWPLI